MIATNQSPSRALFGRLLISATAGFLLMPISSARADLNWLMGGNWVELEKPCTVRLADGRDQNVGMEFLEGTAILYPPYEFNLNLPISTVPAHYEERGAAVWGRLEPRRGETIDLILQRVDEGQLRDSVGYLYRRCTGMMS
jgi:hypothetical protein